MEAHIRNHEIRNLHNIWEWCSRTLHVKWKRKHLYRNDCLLGIAYAINHDDSRAGVSAFELPQVYHTLPTPLLDAESVLAFWEHYPASLLELCLGCFTKGPSLSEPLNRIRLNRQENPTLDQLTKKMRSREDRFGFDWSIQGHHPEGDFLLLKKEMAPLDTDIQRLVVGQCAGVETLAQELLAQGPWTLGTVPATWFVRRTPESLLNRATRLKLWQVAQNILAEGLEGDDELEALCNAFYAGITPAMRAAVESQGYEVDHVVDDLLNFDMRKSRGEITGKR